MAKKTRYYAIVHGKPSGIFNVWEGGAAPATQGVENAVFKSFTMLEGETLTPERSEARHLGGTSRKRNGIALKVRELQAQGIRPVFNIVERHDSKEAVLKGKTRLVKAYVQQGFELVNKTREHREIQELYRAPAVRLDTVIGDAPFDLNPQLWNVR